MGIPEPRKEWKPREAPEFVRHVMGSSAGAGSGEFDVYRGIRRRENRRQEWIAKVAQKQEEDAEFHAKLEANKEKAEEITAKKRNKRQKRKQAKLQAKKAKKADAQKKDGNEELDTKEVAEEEDDEEEEEEEEKHFEIGGK